MKVLVVGASGFIGRALVERLLLEGCTVDAWDRHGGPSVPALRRYVVDLLADDSLPTPDSVPWDAAFHLAAHSVPSVVWTRKLVLENLAMTARVIEHLGIHAPGCRTILASSGHVYEPSNEALSEEAAIGPLHPYGLSKQLCEAWARTARERLDIRVVRAFNQIGPAMAQGLLIPEVLQRIARGDSTILMTGRDDWKDFLDWRDAMDAYMLLLRAEAPSGSVWNLCSGRPTRVSSLVQHILTELRAEREIRFADDRVETLVGNPAKLMHATGWTPRHDLRETVRAICTHPNSVATP